MAETKRPKDKGGTLPLQPRSGPPPSPASAWASDEERTIRMDTLPMKRSSDAPPVDHPIPQGGVELFVIDETQLPRGERKPWRAAEVWTKRRVYGLNSTFRCVEILDRETGRRELGHDLLGARLGGGRLRQKDMVRFSYPLPLPGMEAMFMKGEKHGYTSPVERMIVRIRVIHTSADEAAPTWDEIASRWSEPPK